MAILDLIESNNSTLISPHLPFPVRPICFVIVLIACACFQGIGKIVRNEKGERAFAPLLDYVTGRHVTM